MQSIVRFSVVLVQECILAYSCFQCAVMSKKISRFLGFFFARFAKYLHSRQNTSHHLPAREVVYFQSIPMMLEVVPCACDC